MMSNNIEQQSIRELFGSKHKYVIPIYQRNYAWGKAQIVQLIDDITDFAVQSSEKNYYIGSLVVFQRLKNGVSNFEIIDGQQRLTTIFILLCVLKNEYQQEINLQQNLTFESREISSASLQAIFENKLEQASKTEDLNTRILDAYQYISNKLAKTLSYKKININDLREYLLEKVILIKVPVPEDTDLNHYFEIMNNRGEQLEKHEVLKAKMIETLSKGGEGTALFQRIWEACSNMERYVQYGFCKSQRNKLFGKENQADEKNGWNYFVHTDFGDIQQAINIQNIEKNKPKKNIQAIIESKIEAPSTKNDTEAPSEQFTSPINFANFLLHILRIQTGRNIPLDDKQLLIVFKEYHDDIEFVKKFAFNLLKLRFLLDRYIIKREYTKGQDHWSLKKLLRSKSENGYYANTFDEGENKQILMLLSMFHVSAPTLIYKHWLNATLKYLSEQKNIQAVDYANYLEKLSNVFLYDRYLAKQPKDYFELIYTNDTTQKNKENDIDTSLLNKGTEVENFIFNYLDYQLWKEKQEDKFTFSFRSSVEHFYPQNPIENIPKLERKDLNNFGNLCLITRSQNSRLSNFTPKAKTDFYTKNPVKDSMKQGIMIEYEKWEEEQIREHGEAMKEILMKNCSNVANTN